MTRTTCALLVLALGLTTAVDARAQGGRGGGGGGGMVISEPGSPPRPAGTALILGQVVDAATSAPVGGVIVTLAGPGSPDVMLTDTDGRFVFRDLPRGTYTLTATKRGWGDGAYGRTHPDGSSQTLDVADGARLGDVQVALWKLGAISGTVTDERGEPVVGIEVRVLRRATNGGRSWFNTYGGAGTVPIVNTDDRGMFRFGGVLAGEYTVFVPSTPATVPSAALTRLATTGQMTAADSENLTSLRQLGVIDRMIVRGDSITTNGQMPPAPTSRPEFVYPMTFLGGGMRPASARTVTVAAGQDFSGADLQLIPTHTVQISGTLSGTDVSSAPELLLRLDPASGWNSTPALDSATTVADGNGRFSFPNVPAGDYVLSGLRQVRTTPASGPSAPAPDACYWARVPVNAGDSDISGLDVPLAKCPLVRGRVEFHGSTTHPPPSGIRQLLLWALDVRSGLPLTAGGQAAADGQFTAGGAPPGRYVVFVSPPSGWTVESITLGGRDVTDRPFDLNAGGVDDAVITLTDRLTELTGTVTGAGSVDANAAVLLFSTDTAGWVDFGPLPRRLQLARVDRAGMYQFNAVPAGDYYVVAVPDAATADWQYPPFLSAIAPRATSIHLALGDHKTVGLQTVPAPK